MPATESAGTSDAAAGQRVTQDAGYTWQLALTAAAVLTLLLLLATSTVSSRPLFLVRPPITRRAAGYFQFQGGNCARSLAQGSWTNEYTSARCVDATRRQFATCGDTPRRHWRFSEAAAACGAQRLTPADARERLAGQRLVFAGDSIARNLYAAMLRLLGDPAQSVVVGHADFWHELEGGISLNFFWAPYPSNLTALLTGQLMLEAATLPPPLKEAAVAAGGAAAADTAGAVDKEKTNDEEEKEQQGEEQQQQQEQVEGQEQKKQQPADEAEEDATAKRRHLQELADSDAQPKQQPSLVLLSSTLWHMLHINSADDFAAQLKLLAAACEAYVGAASVPSTAAAAKGAAPHLLLASSTETFPNRMLTVAKQQSMTPTAVDSYNLAMEQAGVLAPAGQLHLLDIFPLTQHCGEECSTDGVHSLPEVYDAALQLMLNVAAARDKAQPRRRLWQRRPCRSLLSWLQTLPWR